MPRLGYTVELCLFLVQLCFKYESAGKYHGIFLRSGMSVLKTLHEGPQNCYDYDHVRQR